MQCCVADVRCVPPSTASWMGVRGLTQHLGGAALPWPSRLPPAASPGSSRAGNPAIASSGVEPRNGAQLPPCYVRMQLDHFLIPSLLNTATELLSLLGFILYSRFKSAGSGKHYIQYWDSACSDFLLYSVIKEKVL